MCSAALISYDLSEDTGILANDDKTRIFTEGVAGFLGLFQGEVSIE